MPSSWLPKTASKFIWRLCAVWKIAEESNSTISEILAAGEKLRKRSIKYRNTDNNEETWTGRGRKPTWLVEALAAGRNIEDFAI